MCVIATGFQDVITLPGIAPFQYLDRDSANTPVIHFSPRGAVEVDGVSSGQSPAVIVDFVDLTGGQDQEFRADRPPGPVGGGAADRPGFESCANGT
jgi:hypothetical protein